MTPDLAATIATILTAGATTCAALGKAPTRDRRGSHSRNAYDDAHRDAVAAAYRAIAEAIPNGYTAHTNCGETAAGRTPKHHIRLRHGGHWIEIRIPVAPTTGADILAAWNAACEARAAETITHAEKVAASIRALAVGVTP